MSSTLDPKKRYLIVNADDLGMSRAVNRAIFEGHERGIVTSASIMATGAEFDDAVAGARARPELGVGVHLVLHDERPAAPVEKIPALVGADGRLKPLGTVVSALFFGRIPREQVETEYAAQIERVTRAGLVPTHLDSHCHLHALPSVGRIVHDLGVRFGVVCARRPEFSSISEFQGAPIARYPLSILITLSNKFARRGDADRLQMPDEFIGLVKSGEVDKLWLERALAKLARGKVSELMVHPSDGTDAGNANARYGAARRRAEFEAVTAPEVRAALAHNDVELVNYRYLASRPTPERP
ncbi:MAG: ChbG/HpnK family deacetylase [Planctomycetes bacterium]|nr:ChbG/HpnK family deacetylase [Planctomycetota bacterium]